VIYCVIAVAKQPQKRKDHVADALSLLSKTVSDRKTFVEIFLSLLILFIVKHIFPISHTIQKFQED
jgi:hypothetical protein